ncbi:hypothetical protein TSAR_013216, partial [Trichomalopsis sarcophagae]
MCSETNVRSECRLLPIIRCPSVRGSPRIQFSVFTRHGNSLGSPLAPSIPVGLFFALSSLSLHVIIILSVSVSSRLIALLQCDTISNLLPCAYKHAIYENNVPTAAGSGPSAASLTSSTPSTVSYLAQQRERLRGRPVHPLPKNKSECSLVDHVVPVVTGRRLRGRPDDIEARIGRLAGECRRARVRVRVRRRRGRGVR